MRILSFVYIFILLGLQGTVFAQNENAASYDERPVVVILEEMPVYPGGDQALIRHISDELSYPIECRKQGIMGVVFVTYCVNETGKVDSVSVLLSSNELFNAEAIRVIRTLKEFKPGKQDGKPVPVKFTIPIRFVLKEVWGGDDDYANKFIASEYYKLAAKQYESGNKELALTVLNLAIQAGTDWFDGLYLARGNIFLSRGEFNKAMVDFEKAIQLNPDSYDGWLGKGKAFRAMNMGQEAMSAFQEAAKHNSSSVELYESIGLQYLADQKFEEAIQSFSTALSLGNPIGSAYYYRGLCQARLRNLDGACDDWRKALEAGYKEAEFVVQTQCK